MGKITFANGKTVSFDGKPSDSDIEQMAKSVGAQSGAQMSQGGPPAPAKDWFDTALDWGYSAADWVGQNVLKPSVSRFGASAMYIATGVADVAATAVGDKEKTAQLDDALLKARTTGYNFGIFGRGVIPIGMKEGVSPVRSFADAANAGFNTALFLPGLYEKTAITTGEGASALVKGTAKVAGSKATKAAVVQGAADATQTISEGGSGGNAAKKGTESSLETGGALATMNFLSGRFGRLGSALSKTKAGQALADFIQEKVSGFQNLISSDVRTKNAASLVNSVASTAFDVAHKVGGYLKGFVDEKNGLFAAYPENMGQKLKTLANTGINNIYSDLKTKYWQPLEQSSVALSKDELGNTFKALGEAEKKAGGDLADTIAKSGKITAEQAKNLETGGENLRQGLSDWTAAVKNKLETALSGPGVTLSDLYDVIHQIRPRGTESEKAIEASTLNTLYQEVRGSLEKKSPELVTAWDKALKASQDANVYIDKAFQFIPQNNVSPENIVASLINRGMADKDSIEALSRIYGKEGMQTIQNAILRFAASHGAQQYEHALITAGQFGANAERVVPQAVKEAGRAASTALGDILTKTKGVLTSSQQGVLHDLMAFSQFNHEDIIKQVTKGGEDLMKKYESVTRAQDTFKTALKMTGNPSQLAESISKLPIEDLQAVKSFMTDAKVTIQGKDFTAWDVVGANVLQNLALDVGDVFSKRVSAENADALLESLRKLGTGAGSMQESFNEIFGDNPTLKNGLKGLYEAVSFIKSEENLSEEGMSKVGNAMSAFLFAYTHHPIMALGYAKKTLSQLGGDEIRYESQVAADEREAIKTKVETMLKESGKISGTWWRRTSTKLGKFLNSVWTQEGVQRAIQSMQGTDDSSQ